MRIVEERVHAPGERLGPLVEVVVSRSFGKLAAVLLLDVFNVGSVLGFRVVDPCDAGGNCQTKDVRLGYEIEQNKRGELTGRNTHIEAGFRNG